MYFLILNFYSKLTNLLLVKQIYSKEAQLKSYTGGKVRAPRNPFFGKGVRLWNGSALSVVKG